MGGREHRPPQGRRGVGLTAYESADGFAWKPLLQDPPLDKNAMAKASHIVFSGEHAAHGSPYFDARETDPRRRYKMPSSDLSKNPIDASYGACRVAVSPARRGSRGGSMPN